MKRSEAEHVLRAAAAITQEQSFVVVLLKRVAQLDAQKFAVLSIAAWIRRRAAEAQP